MEAEPELKAVDKVDARGGFGADVRVEAEPELKAVDKVDAHVRLRAVVKVDARVRLRADVGVDSMLGFGAGESLEFKAKASLRQRRTVRAQMALAIASASAWPR